MDTEDKSIAKARRQGIIVMIITISLFTIVIGGVSFAYFAVGRGTIENANINVTTPAITANKNVIITNTACNININDMSKFYSSTASNITPVYNTNCNVTININGNKNDNCSFSIKLDDPDPLSSPAYTRSVTLSSGTFEYSGTLKTGNTTLKEETQMDTLAGTTLASGQTITVSTTNIGVSKTYTLNIKLYNLEDVNQKNLFTGRNYTHTLRIADLECHFDHY